MTRPSFLVLLLVLVGLGQSLAAPAGKAADKQPGKEEKLKLAAEVFQIFEAKCADCHGSHLPKPKGKFGYVLDLRRVAANPKYIVRGDPKESELFQMVKNEEMPGEDSFLLPLTAEEKTTVERWVQVGAPHEVPPVVLAAHIAGEKKPEVKLPFFRRLLNWAGKFHPVSTHFPVALLLTAVLAEALAWWLRRSEWMFLVRFLVVLGALSSVPTTVLGWLNVFPLVKDNPSETVSLATIYRLHQVLGTATCVWALVCAVLVCISDCEEGSAARRRFRGALLLGAFAIGIVGFLGGVLNAGGLDHYKF